MKQLAITALLALSGLGMQGQEAETRETAGFTALEVQNGIEVILTQANERALKVEAGNQALLDNILTQNRGGTLKICLGEPRDKAGLTGRAKVYVSAAALKSLKAGTGATVKVSGKISAPGLDIKLATGASFSGEIVCEGTCRIKATSGSVFRGRVDAGLLEADAGSGATVKLSGSAENAVIYSSGASVQAGKLLCQRTAVKAVNAGSAYVNAATSIKADADSSSSITYYGEPAEVSLGENNYAIKRDTHKFALN